MIDPILLYYVGCWRRRYDRSLLIDLQELACIVLYIYVYICTSSDMYMCMYSTRFETRTKESNTCASVETYVRNESDY